MTTTQIDPYIRVISGRGSLTIPERFNKAVRIFLYVDVVREPESPYRSYRVNPPESFYGRVTANIGNYVLENYSIDYERQVFELFNGNDAQLMRAVKCLEKAVRNYVFLGTANPAVVFIDQLAEFEPDRYNADNFKFVCFAGTALRLELRGYEPSDCGTDDSEPTPPPPPPQDEPFDKTPPGEPVEVSPPEEGEEPETDPFPGDEEETPPGDFPFGDRCVAYRVTVNYDFFSGQNFNDFNDFWGEILGIRTINVGTGSEVQVDCYGLTSTACDVRGWYRLTGTGNPDAYANLTLVSIEPV